MSRAVAVPAGPPDFDTLVGPHIEPGFRLATTYLNDPDEARDAVQEAAIKAWRSLRRLRDPQQSRAWFLSIVANQCRSTMRRRWWSMGRNPLGAVRVEWREDSLARSMDIEAGMRRLSPDDRAILHLHFYQDLPLEDVARVLSISTGAARSRLYRAARRLRPSLTEEDIR
ncbi:MAG TPA: sigma-70 family RNA polymerase sigma factor [Candidatus Dormibacteraeota bacterium]|nr:sigma-70 family RNA polymerase sigma factor [Candidatus Dormibacteraeota bacterium]